MGIGKVGVVPTLHDNRSPDSAARSRVTIAPNRLSTEVKESPLEGDFSTVVVCPRNSAFIVLKLFSGNLALMRFLNSPRHLDLPRRREPNGRARRIEAKNIP